jgi:hypothetical protein
MTTSTFSGHRPPIRIVARLRSTLDAEISVADALKYLSVARLSEAICNRTRGRAEPAGGRS